MDKREIKFRVWDEINTEMIYFDLVNAMRYIISDLYEAGRVMQFTGLKDKNCNDVYEGDVLAYIDFRRQERIGVVKYYSGHAGYGINNGTKLLSRGWVSQAEIVGNIYENNIETQ